MNEELICACWKRISELDAQSLNDPRMPLEHLDEALAHFHLAPLQSGRKRFVSEKILASAEPGFKNLSHELLLELRYCLYTGTHLDAAVEWTEKLLRFCEVRLPGLRRRAIDKCGNPTAARLLMLHLAAFLLDYGQSSNDLRFVNTALKLADQKWILDKRSVLKKLNGDAEDVVCGLFQFRMLLMIETTLEMINGGEAL